MSTTGIPSQLWLGLQNNVFCITKFAKRLIRNSSNHIFILKIEKINFNSNCACFFAVATVFSLSPSLSFSLSFIWKAGFVTSQFWEPFDRQTNIRLWNRCSYPKNPKWYTFSHHRIVRLLIIKIHVIPRRKKPTKPRQNLWNHCCCFFVRQFGGQYLVSLRIKGFEPGNKKKIGRTDDDFV